MTRMKLQRGRFLLVATAVLFGCAVGAGSALAQCEESFSVVDDFEFYENTDMLRATWVIVDASKATVDLECHSKTSWPTSWCGSRTALGPAYAGGHYLRLNYLTDTAVGRMVVDPPQDWSCFPWLQIAYRGRHSAFNGTANMRIRLVGDGGSSVLLKPIDGPVVDATICSKVPYCDWKVLYIKISEAWPGRDSVEQVDILLTDFTRNGQLYIDEITLLKDAPPVPVESVSWGAVKAMYR